VPEPDLRFGIKEIKQHKWFNIYQPSLEISKGVRIGMEDPTLNAKVLLEIR
jgi:hypothetical protein